jgi:hypothetical protein
MDLAAKLQIKPGAQVAVVAAPPADPDLTGFGPPAADLDTADAVIAFVTRAAELTGLSQRSASWASGRFARWH